jgi:hypothetical protein
VRLSARLATSRMRKGGSMGPSIDSSWAHLFADNTRALGALGTSGPGEILNSGPERRQEHARAGQYY